MRPFLSGALRRAPAAVLVALAVAVAIRLTVRDRWPILSTVMYATPLPILAAATLASAGLAYRLGLRRVAAGACVAAALLGAWFFAAGWKSAAPVEGAGFRLLLWNLSRGSRGWERVAEEVRAASPDVAVFIEGGSGNPPERERAFAAALPGYQRRWTGDGIGIAVRGGVVEAGQHPLAGFGLAVVYRVAVAGRELSVVAVDVHAHPWRHRRVPFQSLGELLASLPPGPRVVAGDFNTPLESVFFDSFRAEYRHAFTEAGRGMEATWPMPFPVMAIDHVWCGPGVRPLRCELRGLAGSDHRAVIADLD